MGKRASMKGVGASFGHGLHLCAGITSLRRVIRRGSHHDLLNGFLVGSDYRGTAVTQAVDASAVQRVGVRGHPLPVGRDLDLILGLKYCVVRPARSLGLLRENKRVAVILPGGVAEHSW